MRFMLAWATAEDFHAKRSGKKSQFSIFLRHRHVSCYFISFWKG